VTWSGRHRAALRGAQIFPRPVQERLPIWVAVGGTPESVVRAAMLGLPLTIAIIGGQPARFTPLVDLYRRAWEGAGHDPADCRLAINTHAFVADTRAQADSAFAHSYLEMMNRIGRERGWPPAGRAQYDALTPSDGAVNVGGPEQVAEKILYEHELFSMNRYVAQISVGAVAHRDVMRAIELFGSEVAPLVRDELARRELAAAPATEVSA
jgi:alkanesulfonate monooxygenase SsuD/methylene tetrahydromethanopterin reductase-like flavin-dependent oxidoreductase (luciferase family)